MTASAFSATYSDWKLVKTRQVVQIVFEVPLASADAAYEVIGGMPDPSKERWFGIAPLTSQPKVIEQSKREWTDLQPAQQAGIRCNDATFRAYLNEERGYNVSDEIEASEAVRDICDVQSRAELGTNHKARVIWHQLDSGYQAWKAAERVR